MDNPIPKEYMHIFWFFLFLVWVSLSAVRMALLHKNKFINKVLLGHWLVDSIHTVLTATEKSESQ